MLIRGPSAVQGAGISHSLDMAAEGLPLIFVGPKESGSVLDSSFSVIVSTEYSQPSSERICWVESGGKDRRIGPDDKVIVALALLCLCFFIFKRSILLASHRHCEDDSREQVAV